MISYRKLLDKSGIHDIDYVNENGEFYREYRPLDDNVTVGYKGIISYDDTGIHLMYLKEQCLDYESYLEDTPLFNTQYSNYFVVKNCDNNYFTIELANSETKDIKELYESYIKNPTLFMERQQLLMQIEDINDKINNLNDKKETVLSRIRKIDGKLKK